MRLNNLENFKVAISAIKGQKLRTILTISIIAFGIMALVGILTSVAALKGSIEDSFARMGSNTFTIEHRGMTIRINNKTIRPKDNPRIGVDEVLKFKEYYSYPATVSVFYRPTGIAEVKFEEKKTNPNVPVFAVDENYLSTGGYELDKGRNISVQDVENATHVCVIGPDLKKELFPKTDPLGKVISLRGEKFRIVGMTISKGSSMGFGGDNMIFIPVSTGRATYAGPNQSFKINVSANSEMDMEPAIAEATAVMRGVRKIPPKGEDNFNITKSDSLAQMVYQTTSNIRLAAIFIGAITLFGASIALMNIMLVSVTERTREIGVRKAVGANRYTIAMQFLWEAVLIGQIGGVIGMIIGIAIGNIIAVQLNSPFIIPWDMMLLAVVVTFIVGVVSGLYPAVKAARLDPIQTLRYE